MKLPRSALLLTATAAAVALGPWLAHVCSKKFPGRAEKIVLALAALNERNKHLVAPAAWQKAAAIWPTTPNAAFDSLKVEMCEYYLAASVEGGDFDRELQASETQADRPPLP